MHSSTVRSRLSSALRSAVRPLAASSVPAVLATLLLVGTLTACGPTPTAVTISVTSHADGARIVGSRAITVSGNLDGGPITSFEVTLNGTPIGAASHTATTFDAPLTLDDGVNTLEVSATSGAGTTTETLTLTYPFLRFQDFAPADVVIGQPDFTSNTDLLSDRGMAASYGASALVNGVFYAGDYGNSRVLGFLAGIPTSNSAPADFVLGQPDFTTATQRTAADGLDGPQTVATANGKFFVTDYHSSRVLVWNSVPTTDQAPADLVVGQPDFGSSATACDARSLDNPESLAAHGDMLIVADSAQNRVLVYQHVPSANGAPADLVLGQADFTHCTENDDNQDGTADAAPSARTLYYPTDVWTDGTRLIVADPGNHRVLIWTTFPTTNFQPADVVVGQASMSTTTAAAGASGMDYPYFLGSNGNQLFVADAGNNRVLIFDDVPTTDGAAADHVLGQSTFTNKARNDDNQDGTADATPSARTLYYPAGVLATDDALVISDEANRRLLVFRP